MPSPPFYRTAQPTLAERSEPAGSPTGSGIRVAHPLGRTGGRTRTGSVGGGTFDAAVLGRTDEGFQLRGTPEGIERLGGIDVDDAVFGHVRSSLGGLVDDLDPDDPDVVAALVRLREKCRVAKEALSDDVEASVAVMLPNAHTTVRLTRIELEDMIRPRIRDTLEASRRAIRSSGLDDDGIDRVLLVGGSSRIPLVREMVREAFDAPVSLDTHPKHSVALGAARHAEVEPGAAGAGVPIPVASGGSEPSPVDEVPAPPDAEPPAPEPLVAEPPATEPVEAPSAASPTAAPAGRRVSPLLWVGLVGIVLLVVVAAVVLSGGDGGSDGDAAPSTETAAATSVAEPATSTVTDATVAETAGLPNDPDNSNAADETPVAGGFVVDASGLFGAEIPDGWSDIDTGPITVGDGATAPAIVASPDRDVFAASPHEPGLAIWFVPSPYDKPFDEMDSDELVLLNVDITSRLAAIRDEVDSFFERGAGFCRYAPRTISESAAVPYAAGVVVNEECGDDESIWTVYLGWFEARPDLEFTLLYQTRTDQGGTIADAPDFLETVSFVEG